MFVAYNYLADGVRRGLHFGVDYIVPSHPMIATISAGVGWYAEAWGMTYFPGQQAHISHDYTVSWFPDWFLNITILNVTIGRKFADAVGWGIPPIFVPTTSPYFSTRFSLAAAMVTSITLNLIAQAFFGIKVKRDPKNIERVNHTLSQIGLEMPLKPEIDKEPEHAPLKERETYLSEIFSNLSIPQEAPSTQAPIPLLKVKKTAPKKIRNLLTSGI